MAINEITFTDENRNYYYMHRHMAHFEKDAAIKYFQTQKKNNYILAKRRYMKNYLSNIVSYNGRGLEALDLALNKDQEDFISTIDKEIVEALNANLGESIKKLEYEQKINKAYASLDDFINTRELKDFDNLLQAISEATALLESPENVEALLPLVKYRENNYNLPYLNRYIKSRIKDLEGKKIDIKNSKRVISILNSLSSLLSSVNKKKLNKTSLQGYLRNIFSTQIGEYIIYKGAGQAYSYAANEIENVFVGAENIKVTRDNELYGLSQQKNGISKYKTDSSFKNIQISVGEDQNQIEINLGISTKWYKNMSNLLTQKVSITKESSFVNRLEQLLKSNKGKYYAYNAIGLINEDNEVYKELKAAIVARNIDVLISGMGIKGDFSQYIVINGEFYSIWQIIQLIEQYNEGQGSTDEEFGTDIVTVSATGASKIAELTDKYKDNKSNLFLAYMRAKEQNKMMQDIGLSGHFYFNRFKNLLTK